MTYLKFILVIILNLFNYNFGYKYDIKYLLNNIINETNITNTSNVTKINSTNTSNVKKNNSANTLKLKNNTEILPPYLRKRSKFCHIKCDCFFSHTVKNDNICVNNWIRTPGLPFNTMNDNICVKNRIKYI